MPSTTKSSRTRRTGSRTSSAPDTSPTELLTGEASSTSSLTTSGGTDKRISSQGLQSGPTPSDSPDGPTTSKSGPGRARAIHFLKPDVSAGQTTSATSGPSGSGSSVSADLQSYSANKSPAPSSSERFASAMNECLKRQLEGRGSTLFSMKWKERVTPAGRVIPRLVASARRTSANASTGSPSEATCLDDVEAPLAPWATGGTPEQFLARKEKARANGAQLGVSLTSLSLQAQLAGWPTTTSRDAASSGAKGYPVSKSHHDGLTLTDAARLAGWPTTSATDYKGVATDDQRRGQLGQAARLTSAAPSEASGETPSGFPAATESSGRSNVGQLSPELSRWLMGLPPGWSECAPLGRSSSGKRSPTRSRRGAGC